MKQATKHILRRFGYEMRRLPAQRPALRADHEKSLVHCFDQTEGMTSFEEASLLYRLARDVQHGCIVEVGSYRGRSTVALGRGSLDGHRAPVFAFDPHEEFIGVFGGQFGPADRAAFFRAMLATDSYQTVRLINLSSELVAPNWKQTIELLWIDGDHVYEAVKRDFECWEPHLSASARIAFDDSLDPRQGPRKFIDELLATRRYREVQQVGKVTLIERLNR